MTIHRLLFVKIDDTDCFCAKDCVSAIGFSKTHLARLITSSHARKDSYTFIERLRFFIMNAAENIYCGDKRI